MLTIENKSSDEFLSSVSLRNVNLYTSAWVQSVGENRLIVSFQEYGE